MPCLCESCTTTPAPTWTEAFRHSCECRFVVNMADNDERSKYLAGVAARRGEAAADALRRGAWAAIRAAA